MLKAPDFRESPESPPKLCRAALPCFAMLGHFARSRWIAALPVLWFCRWLCAVLGGTLGMSLGSTVQNALSYRRSAVLFPFRQAFKAVLASAAKHFTRLVHSS